MLDAVRLVLAALRSFLKSHLRLCAENVVLRHQLIVLRRTTPRRVSLASVDRLLFVWLYRLWPAALASFAIQRPETVCDGIDKAFAPTDVGARAARRDDRESPRTFAT